MTDRENSESGDGREGGVSSGSKRSASFMSPSDVSGWSKADVGKWVTALGLPAEYAGMFERNDVDGPALLQLDKGDLEKVGVASVGHRTRLFHGINDLRESNGMTAHKHRAVKIAM